MALTVYKVETKSTHLQDLFLEISPPKRAFQKNVTPAYQTKIKKKKETNKKGRRVRFAPTLLPFLSRITSVLLISLNQKQLQISTLLIFLTI